MSIKKELHNLAVAMGASTEGAKTTSDLIRAIAVVKNPLAALTIEPIIDKTVDLLGLTCDDLQSGISIYNGRVSGRLNYVTEYTGYSGLESEQEGNYLAIKASVPGTTGVTITSGIKNSTVTLDSDGILILRVTKEKGNKITFTASKSGLSDFTEVIDISNLTKATK